MALTFKKMNPYFRLMRVDRPIGTILVLMPTLWSLWIASGGHPSGKLVAVFTLGCFLMRSAGCVINDIADRNFDPLVERTKSRPIAMGEVTVKEGLALFLILSFLSFLLVLTLNRLNLYLSVAGLLLAIIYPFSKRIISVPQFVLGVSFGWGVIMAWGAVQNRIDLPAILIFVSNIFWSLAYDSIYALMDRKDDLEIGVKSTAILFGEKSWLAIGVFLFAVLILLGWAGYLAHLHLFFYFILLVTGFAFARQVIQLKKNSSPDLAFRLFKNHGLLGTLIFFGIAADYLIG
jgi:4-hydroxybenzoate polyprenyltransferase